VHPTRFSKSQQCRLTGCRVASTDRERVQVQARVYVGRSAATRQTRRRIVAQRRGARREGVARRATRAGTLPRSSVRNGRIDNRPAVRSEVRAEISEILPNKLLEAHGERLDERSTAAAGASDSHMATVGTLDRPTHRCGEGADGDGRIMDLPITAFIVPIVILLQDGLLSSRSVR
jgi:hypothetical protein